MDATSDRGASPLLTTDEAARYLAISPRQLARLTAQGMFTPLKLGKARRYSRQSLEQWINDQAGTSRVQAS
jgi:excisionase family DNA binding protein